MVSCLMQFQSKRLNYRKYRDNDLDAYLQVSMNEEVMAYITGYSLEEEEAVERFNKVLKENEVHPVLGCYFVSRREDDVYIGTSKLIPVKGEPAHCEIGYALLPDYWGLGYATEMVEYLVDYARNSSEIRRIMAIVDPEHMVSIHILRKFGFEKYDEGTYYKLPAWYYKLELDG